MRNCLKRVLCAALVACSVFPAEARVFIVGQVAEFSGIGNANENSAGAKLWFDHVNATGPHKFEIRSLDDRRDPKQTVLLTRKLIEVDKAVALFGYRSTPSLEAIAPVLEELQVPLVGPFNGSDSVRKKGGRWMFFLRATYQNEIEKLVSHLRIIGISKVAILHQQDSFGNESARAFAATLERNALEPAGTFSYDRKTLDTTEAVRGLQAVKPQAVLMACTSKACASVVSKIRETNPWMTFLILSNAVNDEFLKAIASIGRGVVMSQVMPYPWNNNLPIVKEFSRLNASAKSKVVVSHAALEGFASAKLLTTIALRAGPNADAKQIAEILRKTDPVDLGGLFYDRNATSRYVELTMVSRDGRLIR